MIEGDALIKLMAHIQKHHTDKIRDESRLERILEYKVKTHRVIQET